MRVSVFVPRADRSTRTLNISELIALFEVPEAYTSGEQQFECAFNFPGHVHLHTCF